MRNPESFIGQPIRSLQAMLRVLGENNPAYDRVIPDGIYGPETVRAVSTVQRKHGIPVTGMTDNSTWDTIVELYELALIQQEDAYGLQIVMNPSQIIRRGEQHPNLYLVQAMLQVLSETYGSIGMPPVSGVLDDATADALETFQTISALPVTGTLDKHTWKHLALHYPLAANLT